MSFIFRKEPNPRPWSLDFHIKRMKKEGFVKPYYEPSPEYQLVKMLLAYPKGFGDYYYMKTSEYVSLLTTVARDVAEDRGWDFVKELSLLSRKEGLVKDPPLVVGELFPARSMIVDLLSEYPLNKIYLYALIARKKAIPVTWGRMKKKAIEEVLNSKPVDWLEFQAIKYRNYMYWILKNIHPKPANEDISRVYGWVVGKREPPSDRARVADLIVKGSLKGNEALVKAIEHRLPWEVIRSNVSIDKLDESLFRDAVRKIFTAHDIAMQLSTIATKIGISETRNIIRERMRYVPLAPLYRAITGILRSARYSDELKMFARELDVLLINRSLEVMNRLKSAIKDLAVSKVFALIDVSGSMSGWRIQSVIETLAPIYRLVNRYYVFKTSYFAQTVIQEVDIQTIDDVVGLLALPEGGTPLWDALVHVGKIAKSEDAMLIVFTDEQENVSTNMPATVESVLKNVPTIVIDPAPYPTDFIPKERGKVVGLPGSDINAVLAGLRIQQINQLKQTAGRVDIDELRKLKLVSI